MKSLDFQAELTRAGAMSRGRWGRLGFLIRRYPLGAVGAAILAVFVLAAVFADVLTGFDAVSTNARLSLAAPSAQHPLGADFTGVQDLIPQTIDEPTALSYAAKAPRSLVQELFAVGTPDEVIGQIAEFRDNGLRYLVVGNAGAIQPSLRKSAATTAPYVKVVRGLRKL